MVMGPALASGRNCDHQAAARRQGWKGGVLNFAWRAVGKTDLPGWIRRFGAWQEFPIGDLLN